MSTNDMTVSVCIPTRHRPEMLRHCIKSVLEQTILPHEIVIGDDSEDDRTEELISELTIPPQIRVTYVHNRPPAGVAHNIDGVFRLATSNWLLLIHDDDWLLPSAIENLISPLRDGATPDVIYGTQRIVDAEGVVNEQASLNINPAYGRRPELAGLQRSGLWAAARQQMPNDGFLVSAKLVREVGYLSDGVETECEYTFPLRAALRGGAFFFVDRLVSVYRESAESLMRGHNTAALDAAFTIWSMRRELAKVADTELREHLRSIVYQATVYCGLQRRRRLEALKWALHPRFGVRWWGKESLGVISALLFPHLRERLKHLKNTAVQQHQVVRREKQEAEPAS